MRVAGPANAEHLVYLQAGFPCDHSSLEPLAARLASECGCLVGVGCMPEYDREVPLRPEGYDMEQLLACFPRTVAQLHDVLERFGRQLWSAGRPPYHVSATTLDAVVAREREAKRFLSKARSAA